MGAESSPEHEEEEDLVAGQCSPPYNNQGEMAAQNENDLPSSEHCLNLLLVQHISHTKIKINVSDFIIYYNICCSITTIICAGAD